MSANSNSQNPDATMTDPDAVNLPVADDPQPSGSGLQSGSTRSKKALKRAAQGTVSDHLLPKLPNSSLRDLVTQVYDAKVAETKASRDPRLLKGNKIQYSFLLCAPCNSNSQLTNYSANQKKNNKTKSH